LPRDVTLLRAARLPGYASPVSEPSAPTPNALQLTLRHGDRTIETRATAANGDPLPDAPMGLRAHREGDTWVVEGPDGSHRLRARESVSIRHGALEVDVTPVRQARFARFHLGQGDAVLPLLMLTTAVFVAQMALLWSIFASEPAGGGAGYEPSPEFIARLLRGDTDGASEGVLAVRAPRPPSPNKIENFYLQPGHQGPMDKQGGGERLGPKIQDGDNRDAKAVEEAAPEAGAGEQVREPQLELDEEAEANEGQDGELEDQPVAVHVDEGWGFTDWYDTEDARKDAEEIQKQLENARKVLKIDPTHPGALSVRAYYEYLAFDYLAARKTYETYTELYPEDSAGWNNLALTYKREKRFIEEEAYYRIALSLQPNDDVALINLALSLAHQGRFDEALVQMEMANKLEPDEPYADLHRAKIYALMGKEERAYHFLNKSLSAMKKLDTLHSIEFRQDIRVDPAFDTIRETPRFIKLLDRYYGDQPEAWWRRKKVR
jgi:tetratricopeptide (TPR) repeat protein